MKDPGAHSKPPGRKTSKHETNRSKTDRLGGMTKPLKKKICRRKAADMQGLSGVTLTCKPCLAHTEQPEGGGRVELSWDAEFYDAIAAMRADESTWELLSRLLAAWEPQKVHALVRRWPGRILGAMLGDWGAAALARLLRGRKAAVVLRCCESWPPKKIGRVLARIPVHKAARVLGGLYFATRDPFLSHKEARTVLLQVPEQRGAVRKRDAVCRGFDPQWVAAVLEGSGAARHAARTHSGPAWEPEGGGESESYDSSFIDDDDGPSATNSAESGEVESS